MESLFQTIKAKGISNTIRKMLLNIERYHFSTKKTLERFNLISDILQRYGAKMTIHVPAILFEYHLKNFKKINDRNIEWAMHGYKHIDHSKLNYNECYKQLKHAKKVFNKIGINPMGFRAPYLRSSHNVLKALSELGIIYDSSPSVFIDVIDNNNPSIKNILNFYNSNNKWIMEKKFEVQQIPVILPDDEILVDRLKLSEESIGKIWIKVAKVCLENRWIFVMQLHPDRIEPCSVGLKMVLDWANENKIWLPSLSEIVEEGGIKEEYNGAIAITGDLDLFSIWDYYRIS